jgi:hypothetical protein
MEHEQWNANRTGAPEVDLAERHVHVLARKSRSPGRDRSFGGASVLVGLGLAEAPQDWHADVAERGRKVEPECGLVGIAPSFAGAQQIHKLPVELIGAG